MTATPRNRAPRPARRGFTLLETAMTLVIIAVGVLAIIESQQYFFMANTWSSHAATGTFLANEIREMTRRYPNHDPVTGLSLDESGNLLGWGYEDGEITVADFDDIDDFDGMSFRFDGTAATLNGDGVYVIDDNDLPGPIDAFGKVIDGLDGADAGDAGEAAAFGWIQNVTVEKVDPFDYAVAYADDHEVPPAGTFPGIRVDRFPLRVIVTVDYQGPFDAEPAEVARVSWIAP